jgi:epsilon-lactone hydrolase
MAKLISTIVAAATVLSGCRDRVGFERVNTPTAEIRARVTVTDTTAAGIPVVWLNRQDSAKGVIVYLHGGAYSSGPYAGEWRWLAEIAMKSGIAAVMVIYRLAPEHPFPGAFDDALTAIGALQSAKWILAGASAGAGLSIAVARAAIDKGIMPPAGLLLQAAWVDMTLSHPELPRYDEADPILDSAELSRAAQRYAKRQPLTDSRLSPIHTTFAGFPPTRLEIGTNDMMLPDNRLLRDRLIAAGVQLDYIEEPTALHVFAHRSDRPEAQRALVGEVRWIKQQLGQKRGTK